MLGILKAQLHAAFREYEQAGLYVENTRKPDSYPYEREVGEAWTPNEKKDR